MKALLDRVILDVGLCLDKFFFACGYPVLAPFVEGLSFFKYILLVMLLQLSLFCLPFPPLHSVPPLPPALPHVSSCPWVVHRSSLASSFPILFLTSPVYFLPTSYASYSLYLFPHSPPPPPH